VDYNLFPYLWRTVISEFNSRKPVPVFWQQQAVQGGRTMTEAEWLNCVDPELLLQQCREKLGRRREGLFATAICNRIRRLLTDPVSVSALEVVEAYADNTVSYATLRRAAGLAAGVYDADLAGTPHEQAERYAAAAVAHAGGRVHPSLWALRSAITAARLCEMDHVDKPAFAFILRDIFGNPFRPVAIDPSWLTSTVISLATGIYAEKAFDRMPILADALQDAGCANEGVLNHCRQAGEHVRGCWVIDLLLGKE
jgi:hypothetical protein